MKRIFGKRRKIFLNLLKDREKEHSVLRLHIGWLRTEIMEKVPGIGSSMKHFEFHLSLHYRFVCQEAFRWGLTYPFRDLKTMQKDFLSRLPEEECEFGNIQSVAEEMEKIQKAVYTASFLWKDCTDLMQQYFDALKEMYCQYEQITDFIEAGTKYMRDKNS